VVIIKQVKTKLQIQEEAIDTCQGSTDIESFIQRYQKLPSHSRAFLKHLTILRHNFLERESKLLRSMLDLEDHIIWCQPDDHPLDLEPEYYPDFNLYEFSAAQW